MAERIRVRGLPSELPDGERELNDDLAFDGGIEIEVKHVVDVRAQSRAAGEELTIELDDDDIIESRDADGWVSLTTVKALREQTSGDRAARVDGVIDLVPALASGGVTRGGPDLKQVTAYAAKIPGEILDELNVLERLAGTGIDMASNVAARAAAKKVVELVERPVRTEGVPKEKTDGKPKPPGLYRIDASLEVDPQQRLAADETIGSGRSLVLLHGTFSNTENAFSRLRPWDGWAELVNSYESVYALEHRTLSENPLENAIQLARHLPPQARLHLVSHSRGGLVGEFLSLAAAGRLDPSLHERRDQAIKADEVRQLNRLLDAVKGKSITVDRFVRVASPASGTILASERIDTAAGFLFNVIEKLPGAAGWILTVVKSLALAFLNQRTRPDVIPGLEAMMPDSPFIRLLNASGSTAAGGFDDGLGVVAGDVDRSRWFAWLAEKGADFFYGEEHDYVVDTLSMYQGAQRTRAWVSLHAGPNVNHLSYFNEADSRRMLREWLTLDPEDTGFAPLNRRPPELEKAMAKHRGDDDAPVVFVVPDLFGSALTTLDGELVWPEPTHLVRHGLGSMGKAAGTKVGEVLDLTYGPLVERLAGDFVVETFPYDWQRSLGEAGRRLAERIGEVSEGKLVHIVAHGAGGLVVRAAMDLLDAPASTVGNVLLLGCPNLGTLAPLEWATGNGDLVEKLALLDPRKTTAEIGRALRSYDSVLELLPADSIARTGELWAELGIQWAQAGARLTGTKGILGQEWSIAPIAVAGYGYPTASDVEPHGTTPRYVGSRAGDGMVTTASAAEGTKAVYFVPADHGDLPRHAESLDGYIELLKNGRTQRLDAGPVELDESPRTIAAGRGRHLFPTGGDLERAALGGGLPRLQPPKPGLAIEVVHGDLRFAEHAVMVGHYKGSTLEGAEKALDKHFDRRLTHRDVLGLYPGDVGKSEVIFGEPDESPPAAVIVGMGEIGSITRAKVTKSVAEGAARAAIAQVERRNEGDDGDTSSGVASVAISTVLIGNNGPSGLSIDNAVAAVTAGVIDANRLLGAAALDRTIHINRLQFVELYEDVAIETLHAVHRMLGSHEEDGSGVTLFSAERVNAARHLRAIEGGKSGQPPPEYNRGDWRPIMVESVTRCDEDACVEGAGEAAGLGSEVSSTDDDGAPSEAATPDTGAGARTAAPAAVPQPAGSPLQPRKDLTFTSIGMAARAERLVHAWQRQLVGRIIDQVIGEQRPEEQVYNTLYELLVPNYLKGVTSDADNILLVLDSESTRYPWEMLATRTATGEVVPISARSGVIRRLISSGEFQEPKRAVGTKALVIGDPPSLQKKYPRLDGARREAERVAAALTAQGFEVTEIIPTSNADHSLEIVNALFSDEYRIVHIAAHGVYSEDPEKSGVVIGPDAFLSPLTFRQMVSVPPLVFLNCCHVGTIDEHYRDFAASVSEQLIRDGVRAVVAAGWKVNDVAAGRFAETFYADMFSGEPFGASVKRARRLIYNEYGTSTNTWGAYQCYGDPGFKLVARSADWRQERPIAAKELVDRLRDIGERAGDTPQRALAKLREEIEGLLRGSPSDWWRADSHYAAASAYAEIGRFGEAISYYRQALAANDGMAPLRAIEQLANLLGREAARLADELAEGGESAPSPENIARLTKDAQERLELLLELAQRKNVERPRLMAAHHKRLAQAQRRNLASLRKHLKSARQFYEQARREAEPEVDPDTTINAVLFDYLVFRAGVGELEHTVETRKALVEASKDAAQKRMQSKPSFWNRVAAADAGALMGLVDGDLADHVDDLVAEYLRAFRKRSTARERRSVIDHFWFLKVILERLAEQPGAADDLDVLATACCDIYEGLSVQR